MILSAVISNGYQFTQREEYYGSGGRVAHPNRQPYATTAGSLIVEVVPLPFSLWTSMVP